MDNTSTAQETTPKKRSYKVLWIMILLFGLPYVAALYVYMHRDEISFGTQTNYGQIIHPVKSVPNDSLAGIDGTSIHFSDNDIKGKWVLLTVASALCEQQCMDNMYKMRQIRKAVGEDSLRLQRILMLKDDIAVESLQQKLNEYSCMHTQFGDAECLKIVKFMGSVSDNYFSLLKVDGHDVADGIYIIDPLGQYMMFYTADSDPKKMLKDIQRLLKVSKIG